MLAGKARFLTVHRWKFQSNRGSDAAGKAIGHRNRWLAVPNRFCSPQNKCKEYGIGGARGKKNRADFQLCFAGSLFRVSHNGFSVAVPPGVGFSLIRGERAKSNPAAGRQEWSLAWGE